MRVICLVPSLTETLLECGVNVVGRTRFCIHPASRVAEITRVGGTKGVDWERCATLSPDIVIFDREENIKAMAEACPWDWHATHITSVDNIGSELLKLAQVLENTALAELGAKWNSLASLPDNLPVKVAEIPGLIDTVGDTSRNYQHLEYVIWRDPWMVVGPDTFIQSMLGKLGMRSMLVNHDKSYPELEPQAMQRDDTFYLFSSEPFPFARHKQALIDAGFNGAIVDGEGYSWFGIRSFNFLHQHLTQ
ncbi:MAG: helical backbone metal receptor [Pseudomonadota bacterium]